MLKRFDLILLLVMLLARIMLLTDVYPDRKKMTTPDSRYYEGLALSLYHEGKYFFGPEEPYSDLARPPAYPLFICLNYLIFGPDIIFPVLWNLAGLVFLYLGIIRLFKLLEIPHLKITLVVFALDISWLLISKDLMAESLFTPLLIWAIIFFLRGLKEEERRYLIYSALLLALATLFKPITLYLFIVLSGFLLFKFRSLGHPILYAAIFLFGISPWLVRNKIMHNAFAFTSLKNNSLALVHAAHVYADIHKVSFQEARSTLDARLEEEFLAKNAEKYNEINRTRAIFAQNILVTHPFIYAKNILRGMFATLINPGASDIMRVRDNEQVSGTDFSRRLASEDLGVAMELLKTDFFLAGIILTYLIFLVLVSLICIPGIIYFWKKNPGLCALFLLITFYLLFLNGPAGQARLRLYVFPFLLVFFDMGIKQIREFFTGNKYLGLLKFN